MNLIRFCFLFFILVAITLPSSCKSHSPALWMHIKSHINRSSFGKILILRVTMMKLRLRLLWQLCFASGVDTLAVLSCIVVLGFSRSTALAAHSSL